MCPRARSSPGARGAVPVTLISTGDATNPGGHTAADTNEIPACATWPNGYNAFYFMKHAISQGQYAELLNSMSSNGNEARYNGMTMSWCRKPRYDERLYGVNGFSIKHDAGKGVYAADFPDRHCNMLSFPDIMSWLAWAGLRAPTDLEYEKACRGPREVAGDEDAWTPETCKPADGLGMDGAVRLDVRRLRRVLLGYPGTQSERQSSGVAGFVSKPWRNRTGLPGIARSGNHVGKGTIGRGRRPVSTSIPVSVGGWAISGSGPIRSSWMQSPGDGT